LVVVFNQLRGMSLIRTRAQKAPRAFREHGAGKKSIAIYFDIFSQPSASAAGPNASRMDS
jgi:hypothetical protein